MDVPFIEWAAIASGLVKIAIAYVLALPVAWDREQEARSAGLRTCRRALRTVPGWTRQSGRASKLTWAQLCGRTAVGIVIGDGRQHVPDAAHRGDEVPREQVVALRAVLGLQPRPGEVVDDVVEVEVPVPEDGDRRLQLLLRPVVHPPVLFRGRGDAVAALAR